MDNEILDILRNLNEKIWELSIQLNEYTDHVHNISAENISDSAGGIDELGSSISDAIPSIDELATIISSQEKRIDTLEKEVEFLKGEKA